MSSLVRGEAGGEQQMLNHYLQVARGPRYSRGGPEMGTHVTDVDGPTVDDRQLAIDGWQYYMDI